MKLAAVDILFLFGLILVAVSAGLIVIFNRLALGSLIIGMMIVIGIIINRSGVGIK